jgi:hypothetical protein
MNTDDNLADWDAAYVLDALTAQERQHYERFLAEHPERAADAADLEALPAILDVLTPEEAYALLDEPATSTTTSDEVASLSTARAKRQRRFGAGRWTTAVAAAAALLILGGVIGYTAIPRSSAPADGVTLQAMGPGARGGVQGALAVTPKGWGTRLDWTCEYTADWATTVSSYDLVVTTVDGRQSTVASWSPAGDEASGLAAATVIPASQIRTVDIRVAGTDTPLAVTTVQS